MFDAIVVKSILSTCLKFGSNMFLNFERNFNFVIFCSFHKTCFCRQASRRAGRQGRTFWIKQALLPSSSSTRQHSHSQCKAVNRPQPSVALILSKTCTQLFNELALQTDDWYGGELFACSLFLFIVPTHNHAYTHCSPTPPYSKVILPGPQEAAFAR